MKPEMTFEDKENCRREYRFIGIFLISLILFMIAILSGCAGRMIYPMYEDGKDTICKMPNGAYRIPTKLLEYK